MQDNSQAESNYSVPNLVRAFKILELMAAEPQGLCITEIAEKLEYPKNSVFRICKTLHKLGYLIENKKSYFLSTKLLATGYAALGDQNLVEKAIDIMRDLRDEVNETTLFGTLFGNEGVILEQVVSHHSIKFVIDVGHRFALHTAAPGKAMLAFLPEKERNHIIDQIQFVKYTEHTITSITSFIKALAEVREKGYALDYGERLAGVNCIAAPIFNYRNMPAAALWITGPDFRMKEEDFEKMGPIVKNYASKISQRFGYEEPPPKDSAGA